ncbi:la-related protein 6-like [Limulus polyphemus]|uniref:La-related protein 6-like n=1 Tax=Limulus polyphemus TaxID=6850 RepID=A0ABM1BQZ9_LIMPO|nr:la-related protein 6-like [Limulus polyphemus]
MARRRFDSTSSSEPGEYLDAECDLVTTGNSREKVDIHLRDGDFDSDSGEDRSKLTEFFQIPSQDLVDKIIHEVESYFSDQSLLKDTFLLKHIKRNKQGYVSLKLVASFRKVKRLSKDWKIVAYSLRQSKHLDLNKEGTKIKRKNPLPKNWDPSSRSIVAYNLPVSQPSVEIVKDLFSKCGEISTVRILQPGNAIPADIKRHLPRMGSTVCAVVEFTEPEAAKKATVELDCSNTDWRSLRVVPLVSKKSTLSEKNKKSDSGDKRKKKDKWSRIEQLRRSESLVSSGSETDCSIGPRQRSDTASSSSSGYVSSSPRQVEWIGNYIRKGQQQNRNGSPIPRNNKNGEYQEHETLSSSHKNSWIQRRREIGTPQPVHNSRLIPEGVIRLPRGPDSTKGFNRRYVNPL